ncbi:hypothetical protein NKW43_05720 [Gluconobacter albidus]|uniref:hypothetical protein n=1 Tax=Gluconobacter albidus TaxID=318683 RepID=UPI00209FBA18|nr:hypothetical protein [Gluconobacter albidus]MCP1273183.1 hypothetical protein [Gluconobacter albidus]
MASSADNRQPSDQEIAELIATSAADLLERAIELRLSKTMLKPVYAQHGGETIEERLTAMKKAITARLSDVQETEAHVRQELTDNWPRHATNLAPGSAILDKVFSHYGYRYKKEVDGRRLAERIDITKLDPEVTQFLKKIGSPF